MNFSAQRWITLTAALGFVGFSLGFGAEPNRWPFLISPQGFPNLEIALGTAGQDASLPPLTVRHVLAFDGQNYFSRFVVPGLSSSLLQSGRDEWEWERFGGGVFLFKNGKSVDGTDWKIERRSMAGGVQTTLIRGGHDESDEFAGCYLQRAKRGTATYAFRYQGGRLVEIAQTEPVARSIVRLEYSDHTTVLHADGRDLRFEYNDLEQLTTCIEAKTERCLLGCRYSSEHLLERIEVPGRVATFTWHQPDWKEYFSPATPAPPVVTNDGRFAYRTDVDDTGTNTRFTAVDGSASGSWKFDRRSGALTFSLARGKL